MDTEQLMAIMQPAASRNRDPDTRDDAVIDMIEAWIGLLEELIEEQEFALTPKKAKLALEQHVDQARDKLFDALRDEGFADDTIRVFDRLFAKGYDRAIAG